MDEEVDLDDLEEDDFQKAIELSLQSYKLDINNRDFEIPNFSDNDEFTVWQGNKRVSFNKSDGLFFISKDFENYSCDEKTSTACADGASSVKKNLKTTKLETLPFFLLNSLQIFPIDADDIPSNWDRKKLSKSGNPTVLELTEERYEYKEVCKALGDLVQSGLIQMKRYQNLKLWQQYMSRKTILLQNQSQNFSLNEGFLIYELKRSPKFILENEWSISQCIGPFGIALYFRDHIMSRHGEKQELLLCKVMLGDIKVYPDDTFDPSLTKAPHNESYMPYHSIKGCISGVTQYVVYDKSQVYPEYVITVSPPETLLETTVTKAGAVAKIKDSHEDQLNHVRMLMKKAKLTSSDLSSEAAKSFTTKPVESTKTVSSFCQSLEKLKSLFITSDNMENFDFTTKQRSELMKQSKSGIQTQLDDLLQITGLDPVIGKQYLEMSEYELGEALELFLCSLL